jgi:hypothetical protein
VFLTVSFAVIGAALVSLSVATTLPVLGLLGAAYLIGARLSRPRGDGARRPLVRSIFGFLVVAVGAMSVAVFGYVSLGARPADPDAFYAFTSTAPTQPGILLRAEPFTRVVPTNARVWRILYTTTRADNVPAIASAIVLAPSPPTSDARPVVAWTHGTTGVAPGCAPSVLPPPFPFDATVPALERLIAEKWVLVGTDYVGLGTAGGHPYLIGEPEGRRDTSRI